MIKIGEGDNSFTNNEFKHKKNMRLKAIPIEENKSIVYFPDSLRFFEVTNDLLEILNKISDGKTYQYFSSRYENFTEENYKEFKEYCCESIACRENPDSDSTLFRLVLNISNVCNMNCRYCYAGGGAYGDKESLMNIDVLDKILTFFYRCYDNIEVIQLFGGEPTLNVEAMKYVCEYIQKNNKNTGISMVTNGTNLNEELMDLIDKYHIFVTVSIDCKELHDNLRPFNSGRGTYEIIKNNINELHRRTGQPGQVEITYTKQHDKNEISIQKLIESINCDLDFEISAHIAPVCTQNEDFRLDTPDRFFESIEDYYKCLGTNRQMHYSYIDRFLKPIKERKVNTRYCGAGIGTIAVDGQGNVYPCFYFVNNDEFVVGNILEDTYEVLKHKLEGTKKKYLEYDRNHTEKCKDCFANTICYGCLGINYSMTGNAMEMSEFHCEWVKTGLETTLKNAVLSKRNK